MEVKKKVPSRKEVMASFPNYTKEFYNFLKIPKSEVFQGSDEERVKQILIIIAGTMGIGKTVFLENIIKEIRDYYGEEKTNAVLTRVSTKVLLEYAFVGNKTLGWDAKKPIQILVFDDASSVKLNEEDQRRFCTLRHKMMNRTGLKEGVVYSILVTHDWFRLDPNFRRNALVTCFLSVSPLDLYSRREYGRFITEEGVEFLSKRLSKALREDKYKGTGLVVLPFEPFPGYKKVGIVKWKYTKDVDYVILKDDSGLIYFDNKIER